MRKRTENCILMDSDGFRILFVKLEKPTEFDFPLYYHSVGFLFCRIPGLTVSESVRWYGTVETNMNIPLVVETNLDILLVSTSLRL